MAARKRKKKQQPHRKKAPWLSAPDQNKAGEAAPRPWGHLVAGVAIVVVALAAYANSFDGQFVFDDRESIVENETIRSLSPPWGPLKTPIGPTTTGRPVVNLSLAVDYALHGTDPRGYHLANLAIHGLAALALFGIIRRTLARRGSGGPDSRVATGLALAVAAIWAAHPLHTSCVTYVVQRAESLMGLFYLLTLYLVIRGAEAARPWPFHAAAVAACWLGIASKEVMLTAPVVILIYDRVFLAGSFRELARRRWALYLGLASSWALLYGLLLSVDFKHALALTDWHFTTTQYTLTQLEMVTRYLRLAFWPSPLVFDYGIYWVEGLSEVIAEAALIGLLLLGTLWALRSRPALGFLGVWFFAILSPTSSIIKLINQTAAEYRMYLPLAAVVTLVVVGGYRLWERLGARLRWTTRRRRAAPAALACAAVVALALATRARNEDYADPVGLWQDNVAKWPGNPRAHMNLGLLFTGRGEHRRALEEYRKAYALRGDIFEYVSNLAIAHQRVGQPERAIDYFTRAIELKPDAPDAHHNRGTARSEAGRHAGAIRDFTRAIELEPDYVEAFYGRGGARYRLRDYAGAIADFTRVIELVPEHRKAYSNRAVCHFYAGQYDRARADVRRLRELGGEPNPELERQLDRLGGS